MKALYGFARTADDIADEGDEPPASRLQALAEYRSALEMAIAGRPDPQARWPEVFDALRQALCRHPLPAAPLRDLLSAFEQDVHNPAYADRAALLDYCRRSANPVGRLLLALYGVHDRQAEQESDAVCSALQLINFWQDLGHDLRRGRCYVPEADLRQHGLTRTDLAEDSRAVRTLVADLCRWSEELMLSGAPLVHRLPGRIGWELRLVVQGGLRVLEKIRRMDHATLSQRPALNAGDALPLLLRALRMRRPGVAV